MVREIQNEMLEDKVIFQDTKNEMTNTVDEKETFPRNYQDLVPYWYILCGKEGHCELCS